LVDIALLKIDLSSLGTVIVHMELSQVSWVWNTPTPYLVRKSVTASRVNFMTNNGSL
jgi:hypothetical protein